MVDPGYMSAIRKLTALGVLIATVATGYAYYRNHAMDRLYAEAAGIPPFFRSTAESKAALNKLTTYRGRRSTALLLEIASQENPFAPEVQTEAIKALRKYHDPEVAVKLSSLLQPHEGLDTRKAAALALQDLPCKVECIASVLHYLERIWRGELNHEDRWLNSSDRDMQANTLTREKEALYAALYTVLRQERAETIVRLSIVYGLGSTDPSPFALDLAPRLGLQEACPYLLQSREQLTNLSADYYKAPRQELQKAIASLKCE